MVYNLAAFMRGLSRNPESLNLLEPSGPVQAYYKDSFTVIYILWFFGGRLLELFGAFEQDQDGILILLKSCLQNCMTYTIAVFTVKNS
jgi:hypothetical protein